MITASDARREGSSCDQQPTSSLSGSTRPGYGRRASPSPSRRGGPPPESGQTSGPASPAPGGESTARSWKAFAVLGLTPPGAATPPGGPVGPPPGGVVPVGLLFDDVRLWFSNRGQSPLSPPDFGQQFLATAQDRDWRGRSTVRRSPDNRAPTRRYAWPSARWDEHYAAWRRWRLRAIQCGAIPRNR
jgi:hypothetical protein